MSSQPDSNSFNYQYQNNNNYNSNSNNNYDQNNKNYSFQNNNDYIYDPYNNKYGYIIKYHNNYPVYSYIPPSFPPQNKNNNQTTNSYKNEKVSQNTKLKRGIILNIPKEDICYLRPPEYQPGYIKQTYGKPKYIENPPK